MSFTENWKKIVNSISGKQNLSSKSNSNEDTSYLNKLAERLDDKKEEGVSIPFKILELKNKGFIVKVGGLPAYVSFNHMPWKYEDHMMWRIVFPYIVNKRFYCKVHSIQTQDNSLSVVIDGDVPQLSSPDFIIDNKYKGLILQKFKNGLYIDLGYHFAWKCGSIISTIKRYKFDSKEVFDALEEGQILDIYYWGNDEKDRFIIGVNNEFKEWHSGQLDEIVDDIVTAKVTVSETGERSYIAKGMYNASLPIIKSIYFEKKQQVRAAVNNLIDGDCIQCRILKADKVHKQLRLKWINEQEIQDIRHKRTQIKENNPKEKLSLKPKNRTNAIKNRIDEELAKMLNLIGDIVKVEVLKNEDKKGRLFNSYIVSESYKGKLIISNPRHRISVQERKNIELNLQDGEVIYCEVISIKKKLVTVRWNIGDDELYRFL